MELRPLVGRWLVPLTLMAAVFQLLIMMKLRVQVVGGGGNILYTHTYVGVQVEN